MAKRVSHSLLDPFIAPLVPRLYRVLHIPRWFPPEGIVLAGHVFAIGGAFAFAWSACAVWGGLAAAAAVALNHLTDMVDGTHARRTGQCRNGGELLDHFTDPLSFSYWIIGLAVSCGRLELGIAGVIFVLGTAVLTNIRAKLLGEFSLARIGPTEFKTLLVLYGIAIAIVRATAGAEGSSARTAAAGFLWAIVVLGNLQLAINLVRAVLEVNRDGPPPDSSEWRIARSERNTES